MGGDGLAVGAGEGHVDQGVGVEQLLEGAQRVQAVVVPLQVELLRGLHLADLSLRFFSKIGRRNFPLFVDLCGEREGIVEFFVAFEIREKGI